MSLPFSAKAPWWARLIGWWRRRQWEKRDRAERLAAMEKPVFQGAIIGKTHWTDAKPPFDEITHRWDLYETPSGERSVKFIRTDGRTTRVADGLDHSLHAQVITPWLAGRYTINWQKTRADAEGNIWGKLT